MVKREFNFYLGTTSTPTATANELNKNGTSATGVGNSTGLTMITGSSVSINTGTNSAMVAIGNSTNTIFINSSTINIGTGAFTTAVSVGSIQPLTTVKSYAGAGYSTLNNTNYTMGTGTAGMGQTGVSTATIRASYSGTLASNGSIGTMTVGAGSGYTAYATSQNTGTSTIGGIVDNKSYTNKISGNTYVDGNVYINGTLDYVSSNTANTTVIGSTTGVGASSLTMSDNDATFSDSTTGAPVQVHGVNDGTSDFDAVNVRQFSSAIASVTAMANIPQVDQDKMVAVGMAMGSFMGKTALAAGVTYRFTKNGVLKGSVSSAMNSSNSTAVGVGAAWSY